MVYMVLKSFFIALIRIYQIVISPFLGQNCRFHPTCSAYTIEAIEKLGVVRGSYIAIKRLMRCHPFCDGGYDPVKDK